MVAFQCFWLNTLRDVTKLDTLDVSRIGLGIYIDFITPHWFLQLWTRFVTGLHLLATRLIDLHHLIQFFDCIPCIALRVSVCEWWDLGCAVPILENVLFVFFNWLDSATIHGSFPILIKCGSISTWVYPSIFERSLVIYLLRPSSV